MNWKDYSHIRSSHAFLSPSNYHWLNYTEDKLLLTYSNKKNISRGTKLHSIAADLIRFSLRMPNTVSSFNSFVNDAIGFKMQPEQLLFYTVHCYGTADAISYHDGVLRVHDLKTGMTPGSMNQLLIYAALFCLDYAVEPKEIHLRIYQNGELTIFNPSYPDIMEIISIIREANKIIEMAEETLEY